MNDHNPKEETAIAPDQEPSPTLTRRPSQAKEDIRLECNECERNLPLSAYSKRQRREDGVRRCMDCIDKQLKETVKPWWQKRVEEAEALERAAQQQERQDQLEEGVEEGVGEGVERSVGSER
ncbi:hypothetical protein HK097_008793 [Rhizophlyctis rosea]|uniref:Stc1 domain-containing protein n=1 Tax=Rhizophlyctis rosea TaxID=64517 RepID=A0AAD5SD11_9FUNG|nr:hypothetical protein HK097_008793 [Rhizophlyctis rosea]